MNRNQDDILLRIEGLETFIDSARGTVRAVDGIRFSIRRGETFALLGESGCGKSMTALSLLRLLPPNGRIHAGRVWLEDRDLVTLPEAELRRVRGRRIAMIFQEPMTSLNPVMPVGEQVAEVLRLHMGLQGEACRGRVVELLDSVGIPDAAQRAAAYPHQLSGGMKQRVMIAMALAGEPDLLIADEPTTALDVTIQAQVLDLLREIQARSGMAILLITHDLGVVAKMADRVAVMYAGHVVEQSSREDFFARPAHPYSQKLFEALPEMGKRDRTLAVIPGQVPALNRAFVGCRFHDRCDRAWTVCARQPPRWTILDETTAHGVRCHLYDEEQVARRGGVEAPSPRQTVTRAPTTHTESGAALLRVTGLKMHFPVQKGFFRRTVGHVFAVDDVSLEVPKGRTVALVGESGCGKTTVGKSILQLIRPTAGSVQFEGEELTRLEGETLRRRRRDFQLIFQDPYSSMNPRMRVGDIIAEGMVAQRIGASRAARQARVKELLEQVGLPADAVRRYPHEFSGGQRQRICIARALAVEPRLIVCDEPTSALDVSVQAQILNLLKGLQDELGLAYLFITHNISVVAYLAHEVAVMYLGRIVEQGPVTEVLENPRHPYTGALLSAVPSVDPARGRETIRLQGELPSPSNPPAGCHFHPRCPQARAECRQAYPPSVEVAKQHRVRCFLYVS